MLQGITKNGELKNIRVNDDGILLLKVDEEITQTSNKETTLNANISTIGTLPIDIQLNKKVTSIDIANYSDSADITITIGEFNATIGSSIAATLPINKTVENIVLASTADNTKVQLIIKGVE